MKRFKKILRTTGLIIIIILACMGMPLMLPLNRYKYINKEVIIELVEQREGGTEDDLGEEAS